MLKHESIKLHGLLKGKIKGKIFIGAQDGIEMVNITGFKGITFKTRIEEGKDIEELANTITRKYRSFILNKFFEYLPVGRD